VCRQLAARGAAVFLTARDEGKANTAARAVDGDVRPLTLDVTDQTSVDAGVAAVCAAFSALDILVNNAGINYDIRAKAETADVDGEVRATLETNLLGPWRLARAFAPLLRRSRHARLVMVSSEAGSLATMGAGPPAYQVSKAALNAVNRTLTGEMPEVRVNAVCPGWTATGMGGGGRPVAEGAASLVWAVVLPDDVSIGVQTGPLLGRDRRSKGTPFRRGDDGLAVTMLGGACRACGGGRA
jgi:NAD(P)-dependent dehydrogenase (short-subunit alcohol dehydrogenase family)